MRGERIDYRSIHMTAEHAAQYDQELFEPGSFASEICQSGNLALVFVCREPTQLGDIGVVVSDGVITSQAV